MFAQQLQLHRKRAGLSTCQLAKAVGVSVSMISQMENGYKVPGIHLLVLLAQTLNCTTDELLGVTLSTG